jgi:hypothetical protein
LDVVHRDADVIDTDRLDHDCASLLNFKPTLIPHH